MPGRMSGAGEQTRFSGVLQTYHASCRKVLQASPRQLTSAKLSSTRLMAWQVLPTITGA